MEDTEVDIGFSNNLSKQERFVARMQDDVSKRQNQQQINELKKTVEGRRILKQAGIPTGKAQRGKAETENQPPAFGLGVQGPKIVKHSSSKINDNNPKEFSRWAANSYLF